tara:strand:+ start:19869 stop:20663 length:795 start_codon:yes stop_codon:yes gene_type:complete
MNNKKISIITVVKNGMPYIKSSIKSFELQDYKDKELIIIYSKSDDGTEEFLKKFYPDISYYDHNSLNKFGSINLGLEKASGNIIGLLHADDFFYNENTLKNISSHFDDEVNCIYGDIMFCKKENINTISRVWKSANFEKPNLRFGWTPPHTSVFIKKNLINDIGNYDETFDISSDFDFILRLFNHEKLKSKKLDSYITVMRIGGDSTNFRKVLRKFNQDVEISSKYFKQPYLSVLSKIISKISQFKIFKQQLKNNYIDRLNSSL